MTTSITTLYISDNTLFGKYNINGIRNTNKNLLRILICVDEQGSVSYSLFIERDTELTDSNGNKMIIREPQFIRICPIDDQDFEEPFKAFF